MCAVSRITRWYRAIAVENGKKVRISGRLNRVYRCCGHEREKFSNFYLVKRIHKYCYDRDIVPSSSRDLSPVLISHFSALKNYFLLDIKRLDEYSP